MVFVNYRRTDASAEATLLADHVNRVLGEGAAFIDCAPIAPGLDYLTCVHDALTRTRVMLAVIGPDWLGVADQRAPRLPDRFDAVHTEIRAALARQIPVVPVLVRDAVLPEEQALPDDSRGLVSRRAAVLTTTAFERDAADLLERIGSYLSPSA
jgi:hypothetical protein